MKQKLRDITPDQVDEMIMIKWGKAVTKNGTFASALKDLVGE